MASLFEDDDGRNEKVDYLAIAMGTDALGENSKDHLCPHGLRYQGDGRDEHGLPECEECLRDWVTSIVQHRAR